MSEEQETVEIKHDNDEPYRITADHYTSLSEREHVLHRPDIYVGAISLTEIDRHVLNDPGMTLFTPTTTTTPDTTRTTDEINTLSQQCRMEHRKMNVVPGLIKLFDEVLVNCADHASDPRHHMTSLKVDIHPQTHVITLTNNGMGITTTMKEELKLWVPEMIFFHMRTSSNYNNHKDKFTGGRNGCGVKLVSIFSKWITIEIKNNAEGILYRQTSKNNNSEIHPPDIKSIKKLTGKERNDYVKVSFELDYARFATDAEKQGKQQGCSGLSFDHLRVMYSRVMDIAGFLGPKVNVTLNGISVSKLLVNTFRSYVLLHVPLPPDTIEKDTSSSSISLATTTEKEDEEKQTSVMESSPTVLTPTISIYETKDNLWKVAVLPIAQDVDIDKAHHTSFVNSIHTSLGGTHLSFITDQIIHGVINVLQKQIKPLKEDDNNKKNGLYSKIRKMMHIFVSALIQNADYNSQCKEQLTSLRSTFGSTCVLPDSFIHQVIKKLHIVERIHQWYEDKQFVDLKRNLTRGVGGGKLVKIGSSTSRITGIPGFIDANHAGTKQRTGTYLLLVEGDSAKTFCTSGLSVMGRDKFAVYALRGKVLNAREASTNKLKKNKELTNIVTIMGLDFNMKYMDETSRKKLRYQHVLIVTDADSDGHHILGLVINFISYFWPELITHQSNFLAKFITPIVIATPKTQSQSINHEAFYSEYDATNWINEHVQLGDLNKYDIRYLKGLGSSESKDAKLYFAQFDAHKINFIQDEQNRDLQSIAESMSKNHTNTRKQWLLAHDPTTNFVSYRSTTVTQQQEEEKQLPLKTKRKRNGKTNIILPSSSSSSSLKENQTITYYDFIHKELIQFIVAVNQRMIPNLVDGLKVSQRKILYSVFKRNLTSPIKVAQLAGYVSEHSLYKHGEVSLIGTIINMAQNYPGSNNIELLAAKGAFGTRLQLGKDCASARYISTCMLPIVRSIYKKIDDNIVKYLVDEGVSIEPEYYYPVIPMVLVNRTSGLGMGFSTTIPPYNPRELVQAIRFLLDDNQSDATTLMDTTMVPFYKHFKGKIERDIKTSHRFRIRGTITSVTGDILESTSTVHPDAHGVYTFIITEIPINKAIDHYQSTYLDQMLEQNYITSRTIHSTENEVHITITLTTEQYQGEESASLRASTPSPKIKDEEGEEKEEDNEKEEEENDKDIVEMSCKESNVDKLYRRLNLVQYISTSNMHLFDGHGKLRRYETIRDIILEFYGVRLAAYEKQKQWEIQELEHLLPRLYTKRRFVMAVMDETITIKRKTKVEIVEQLSLQGFPVDNETGDYSPLLNLSILTMTTEQITHLDDLIQKQEHELQRIKSTCIKDMWRMDLNQFEGVTTPF